MKHFSIFSLLLLSFAGQAAAQECPDLGVIIRDQELVAGPSIRCGVGIEITLGGVTYTQEQGFCPSFILIKPEHGVPSVKREKTRIVFGGVKPVHKQMYECVGWFWTACVAGPDKDIYNVDNYRDEGCFEVDATPQQLQQQGS